METCHIFFLINAVSKILFVHRMMNKALDFFQIYFSFAEITSDFVDIASSTYGAIINRDDCRKFVVCTTCNAITHLFPSTKLAMVLTDHVIPSTYKSDMYFVAKQAFINDMQQNCHEVYKCPIQPNDEN